MSTMIVSFWRRRRSSSKLSWISTISSMILMLMILVESGEAKVTFEKMTNRDYAGTTYYTIRNVSLYECLGWCRDEVDCSSASFSFVVNPLAPLQETTCRLQNETQAKISPSSSSSQSSPVSSSSSSSSSSNSVSANPQKAVNLYYFQKTHLRSGKRMMSLMFTFDTLLHLTIITSEENLWGKKV